jgi:hypothetical protein
MTWQVSVISRDTEYNLSDSVDYLLTGIDGIGAAPVARIAERGPMQHGESDLGYRLQSRRIALALLARGGDDAAWFARRSALMSIFRSSDSPVRLRVSRDDGVVRQIDCYLTGTMEMAPEVGLSPRWQRVGIELLAPDPTWYDPVGVTEIFALGAGGQAMDVPLAIPWSVGASTINATRQVSYAGSWDAWPTVIITGPITNCVITNETMGDKLDFSGTTIGAGVSYTIDCRYGYKTVTRSDGANRVQDLTADSNLATFRVGAHPDVLDGINSFRVQGTGCNAATQVVLQFYTRYVGV